jgi:hypothetical protein
LNASFTMPPNFMCFIMPPTCGDAYPPRGAAGCSRPVPESGETMHPDKRTAAWPEGNHAAASPNSSIG